MADAFTDWDRVVVWWHVVFYVTLGLVVLSLVTSSGSGRALTVQLTCVAVIAVAYALVGARAARTCSRALAWSYLTVLVVATIGASSSRRRRGPAPDRTAHEGAASGIAGAAGARLPPCATSPGCPRPTCTCTSPGR